MFTENLIYQNQARYQELLRVAEKSRAARLVEGPSLMSQALARTGDLLVTIGQGLQRRYRRMEEGVALADYSGGHELGRAL